jgi:hypothetical protein
MNKNSLTYRFLRGYLIGFAIAGTVYILPQVHEFMQLLLGLSIGVVGWVHVLESAESNKK